MSIDKKSALIALAWFVIGVVCGFFIGKAKYDKTIVETVTKDTVTIVDTIQHYYPKPVEVEKVRTEYKWLTRVQPFIKTDTLTLKDSVLVEVPIESKHYSAPEYDAYVSGYMPSLDSISVYQRTEYITERVVVSKPPNRFSIGLQGGYGYGFKSKQLEPYVGIGIGIRIF
jgi:hypothetical protein